MKLPDSELQRLLQAVFDQYQRLDDPAENVTARRDFVFHMTDWVDDLKRLARLYARPRQFDKNTAGRITFGFLIHALPHLMAAGRLLLGEVRDPFTELQTKK